MQCFNNGWQYISKWEDAFLHESMESTEVRLPHTVEELPLHYADHNQYQKIVGYKKTLKLGEEDKGKRIFLQFDGAAHIATVYCNGKELYTHKTGYTGFRVEISDDVSFTEENTIVVKLDTTENPSVPPFGFAIDYLTFGGLYRDVWLDKRSQTYLKDVYVTTPDLHTARLLVQVDGPKEKETLSVSITTEDGFFVAQKEFSMDDKNMEIYASNIKPWTLEDPALYLCHVQLLRDGVVLDEVTNTFGYRTIRFDENSFYLNNHIVFFRGLNRHQCFPYVGYAATESLQREDARILKEELHVNAVRTSHYPQSQYFIDECDRRGILVFTELPGWQHIGDDAWKKQAITNVQEMVMQYRQHPSIFLWGVRINESQDDDTFYKQTNEVAYLLDSYRPTSGVRNFENSSLLEDVYAYNDFSHNGITPGAKKKSEVVPDKKKPMFISEANGHMFPTKSFDNWAKRQEHALRHARVLEAAMKDKEHAGCFQWCMFDYPTHRDFGSGDRVCYHGVMDYFRNPKLAASLYASQQDEETVLEISSSMDIGDYPAGQIGSVYAFTNADAVALYKNDDYVKTFYPDRSNGLIHPPIEINDFIGCLLETKENYDPKKAELIHDCLVAANLYGPANLPPQYKAKLAYAMMHYKMTYADGVALFGKYVGNWGGKAIVWRFDAIKKGVVVKSVTKCPTTELHLDVKVSSQVLQEGDTYDMSAIRICIKDKYDTIASYAQLPVHLEVRGPIELVGPSVVTAEGGMTGTYVRTIGESGTGELTISCQNMESIKKVFVIKKGDKR